LVQDLFEFSRRDGMLKLSHLILILSHRLLDALFVSLCMIMFLVTQRGIKRVELAESLAKLDVVSALVVEVDGIRSEADGCSDGSKGQIHRRPTGLMVG
jgi:hypothetical protein